MLKIVSDLRVHLFNIHNIIVQREAVDIIKHYEEIIKTRNKATIRYEAIQGQMLKKFKNMEGLSRSTIYFKTGLRKYL